MTTKQEVISVWDAEANADPERIAEEYARGYQYGVDDGTRDRDFEDLVVIERRLEDQAAEREALRRSQPRLAWAYGLGYHRGYRAAVDETLPRWGFAVQTADGLMLATCKTWREAVEYRVQGEEYLAEAAASGHPSAPDWVDERLPITVRAITRDERADLLDDGLLRPILQRQ